MGGEGGRFAQTALRSVFIQGRRFGGGGLALSLEVCNLLSAPKLLLN